MHSITTQTAVDDLMLYYHSLGGVTDRRRVTMHRSYLIETKTHQWNVLKLTISYIKESDKRALTRLCQYQQESDNLKHPET